MITAIKPTARESYDRDWKLEKDEENVFANTLGRAERRKRRWDDIRDKQVATTPYSFENPVFNIITGGTNYILQELTSELQDHEAPVAQLDLFQDRYPLRKA